jgi:hypothetical protein
VTSYPTPGGEPRRLHQSERGRGTLRADGPCGSVKKSPPTTERVSRTRATRYTFGRRQSPDADRALGPHRGLVLRQSTTGCRGDDRGRQRERTLSTPSTRRHRLTATSTVAPIRRQRAPATQRPALQRTTTPRGTRPRRTARATPTTSRTPSPRSTDEGRRWSMRGRQPGPPQRRRHVDHVTWSMGNPTGYAQIVESGDGGAVSTASSSARSSAQPPADWRRLERSFQRSRWPHGTVRLPDRRDRRHHRPTILDGYGNLLSSTGTPLNGTATGGNASTRPRAGLITAALPRRGKGRFSPSIAQARRLGIPRSLHT